MSTNKFMTSRMLISLSWLVGGFSALAYFYGTNRWLLTLAVSTGYILGIVTVRLVERWREPLYQLVEHRHEWGPWSEPKEVTARTSFDATTSLVQTRRCTDTMCLEVETKDIKLVRAKG